MSSDLSRPIKTITVDLADQISGQISDSTDFLNELSSKYPDLPTNIYRSDSDHRFLLTSPEDSRHFYAAKVRNLTPDAEKPWKKEPHYFRRAHISLQALIKMTLHARLGGNLEIMGMMTGKFIGHDLIVMDCFPLPVHGTESRVNPLNDAYEYMLKYLSDIQKNPHRPENIIGWYHSHPSFGCWLSGIDVQTQRLNQNFQDPYVAVVIDPVQTVSQGKVEIGCFRAYYKDQKPETNTDTTKVDKLKNYGSHADDYYSLDIDIFKNEDNSQIVNSLKANYWFSSLCEMEPSNKTEKMDQIARQCKEIEAMLSRPGNLIGNPIPKSGKRKPKRSHLKFNKSLSELSSPTFGADDSTKNMKHATELNHDAATIQTTNMTALNELKRYLVDKCQESLFL